jgi:hypothetical protein
LTTSETKQDLVATLEIQGKRYDVIVDSGADICLVQPYTANGNQTDIKDDAFTNIPSLDKTEQEKCDFATLLGGGITNHNGCG